MHETFTQAHTHTSPSVCYPISELPNQIFTEHFKNAQNADSLHHVKRLRGENKTGKQLEVRIFKA